MNRSSRVGISTPDFDQRNQLPRRPQIGAAYGRTARPPFFLDPNQDGYLTAADVLAVINYINLGIVVSPEEEFVSQAGIADTDPMEYHEPRETVVFQGDASPIPASTALPLVMPSRAARAEESAPGDATRSVFNDPRDWLDSHPLLGVRAALDPFELEDLLPELLSS